MAARAVIANPDLPRGCGIDIHVILDESGSVQPGAGDVRRAFSAFTSALKNRGYVPNGSTDWQDGFRMGRYFLPRPSPDIPRGDAHGAGREAAARAGVRARADGRGRGWMLGRVRCGAARVADRRQAARAAR